MNKELKATKNSKVFKVTGRVCPCYDNFEYYIMADLEADAENIAAGMIVDDIRDKLDDLVDIDDVHVINPYEDFTEYDEKWEKVYAKTNSGFNGWFSVKDVQKAMEQFKKTKEQLIKEAGYRDTPDLPGIDVV